MRCPDCGASAPTRKRAVCPNCRATLTFLPDGHVGVLARYLTLSEVGVGVGMNGHNPRVAAMKKAGALT